eukprot:scaffold3319_cov427-Prasinococcus_capsulatus_cf.AAC.13
MRAFSAGSSGWRKSVSSSRTFARVACITYLLRLSQCVLSSSKVVRLFSLEFRSQHPTLRPFGAKRRCLHSYHERHTRCHRRTGTQRKGVPSSPAQDLCTSPARWQHLDGRSALCRALFSVAATLRLPRLCPLEQEPQRGIETVECLLGAVATKPSATLWRSMEH